MIKFRQLVLAITVALAGCATVEQTLPVGSSKDAVLQRMGPPTAIYPLGAGTRLQYSWGPYGRLTYNVDLDASGQVTATTQSLQPSELNKLSGLRLSTGDITRELGPPVIIDKVASFSGDVWTWRYWEIGIPRFFHAYVDASGIVVRTLSTDEPTRPWRGD
ncbi:MAG: hypothetical protein EON92_01330 [Burkholderiales bacterium]|nr:MAG: hypothetical protein EON92_01330 [Burkholderiales bacterium]